MRKHIPLTIAVFAYALPALSFAATLSASSLSSSVSVGQTATVQIHVSSTDQSMNAASGVVTFPADKLQVASVSKSGSIISLWAQEPSFSNSAGTISFEGVVLNPGYTGTAGRILTITFRAKSEGQARLAFSSGSVLANDGRGTEILSGSNGSTLTIVEGDFSAPPATGDTSAPAQDSRTASTAEEFTIVSSTHPDQAKWYKNNSPEFSWNLPEGALEIRTLIGENAKATPNVRYVPAISSKKVENLTDGTYFFLVQVRTKAGWGPISKYQVNIDTTPPQKFKITFPHGVLSPNPQPIILFNTTDKMSGIDHYEVKVGQGGPLRSLASADSNPYTLALQEPGLHVVKVIAFDRAGNTADSETEFTVEGIEPPKITDAPTELTIGDILRIRGTTYPNANVEINISEDGKPVVTESAKSNTLGDFGIIVSKRLWPGTYTFTARVTDERGSRSLETEPHTVRVRLHFFSDAITFILNYFFIALTTLAGVAILLGVGIWSWFKLLHLTRSLQRQGFDAQETTQRSFKVLRSGVASHIRALHKVRKSRTLTTEELDFLEQLEDKLAEAEHVISKDIEGLDSRKGKGRRT